MNAPTGEPDQALGRVVNTMRGWSHLQLAGLIGVVSAAIFALDLVTPTGVAGGVPYLLPVTLGLGSRDRRFVMAVAGATSALTVVGMVLAPEGSSPTDYVLANRGLALVAIWVTALGVRSQVALAARLEQAHQELLQRESLARLGEMAAVVAHEVRNPLAGIMGVLQVLETRPRPDGERKVLADVRERLAGLTRTVDDLMAFARPSRLLEERCDLKTLLRETRALIESDGHWPDLELQIEGPELSTIADRQQLRRAVLNVVLNAAAAQSGQGQVLAEVDTQGDQVQIIVSDQGPGVPHHLRDRIFEPFFTTRTQGTGLGLPIVAQTLRAHGGTVDMAPGPTGGTRVTLSLPAREA